MNENGKAIFTNPKSQPVTDDRIDIEEAVYNVDKSNNQKAQRCRKKKKKNSKCLDLRGPIKKKEATTLVEILDVTVPVERIDVTAPVDRMDATAQVEKLVERMDVVTPIEITNGVIAVKKTAFKETRDNVDKKRNKKQQKLSRNKNLKSRCEERTEATKLDLEKKEIEVNVQVHPECERPGHLSTESVCPVYPAQYAQKRQRIVFVFG